jgi:hypothetical protein
MNNTKPLREAAVVHLSSFILHLSMRREAAFVHLSSFILHLSQADE